MNRRGFLGSILIAATAPAIVRADSLMRIIVPDRTIDTRWWARDVANNGPWIILPANEYGTITIPAGHWHVRSPVYRLDGSKNLTLAGTYDERPLMPISPNTARGLSKHGFPGRFDDPQFRCRLIA